ncbi:MAG TPA: zinc-ribbon domain-containing protein [Candidatus Limnocylindrales bacterium]|nr:zinc-ribbon domain-containing protein [Candidatus Limnocylindrales bacterium]
MDQTTLLVVLIGAAIVGMVAVLMILRRDRHAVEDATRESPFAASSEGMKRCPNCGTANLVTDTTCMNCGRPLPG